MEGYERRKMYRVHLKNISEIRNCRTPVNYIAYPSRLFNYSLKKTFLKRNMKTSENSYSQHRLVNNQKKIEERKTCHFFLQQQNLRLSERIQNTSGSIDMKKYQTQYEKHKKLTNLHRKIKLNKRIILYKIYDIKFKNLTPNLKEIFTIFDKSTDSNEHTNLHSRSQQKKQLNQQSDQHLIQDSEEHLNLEDAQNQDQQLIKGNIFELRNMMIRGYRGDKLILKIIGRAKGTATIVNDQKMVSIIHRKQIVGTLILEAF